MRQIASVTVLCVLATIGYSRTISSSQQIAGGAAAVHVFEVASIKPNKSAAGRMGWDYKGETFTVTNVPMGEIVRLAYGIGPCRIHNLHLTDSARAQVHRVQALRAMEVERVTEIG